MFFSTVLARIPSFIFMISQKKQLIWIFLFRSKKTVQFRRHSRWCRNTRDQIFYQKGWIDFHKLHHLFRSFPYFLYTVYRFRRPSRIDGKTSSRYGVRVRTFAQNGRTNTENVYVAKGWIFGIGAWWLERKQGVSWFLFYTYTKLSNLYKQRTNKNI